VRRIVDAAYAHYIPRIGKQPGPMLDDYAALIADGDVWVIGAPPAGLIVLLDQPDHLLLDNVAVDPAQQSRGLGRALLDFADAEARRRGFAELRLYTHQKMTENIAIYTALGWQESGRGEQNGYDRVFFRKSV
jgi:GNAT superfamily N-acetyltransferase